MFSEAVDEFDPNLLPILSKGGEALNLESTLQELPLYQFQAELSCLGIEVAQIFERHPRLPGVILVEQGQFVAMISRQQLLEHLLHPHGIELFLKRPLRSGLFCLRYLKCCRCHCKPYRVMS